MHKDGGGGLTMDVFSLTMKFSVQCGGVVFWSCVFFHWVRGSLVGIFMIAL